MEAQLILVVVHWMIKPDPASVEAFLEYWSTQAEPSDRSVLVGEFLSHALSRDEVGFACVELEGSDDWVSFYNVGIWETLTAFKRVIMDGFASQPPKQQQFEYRLRERMVLDLWRWRRGCSELPLVDRLL